MVWQFSPEAMILPPRQFTVNRLLWLTIVSLLFIDVVWIWEQHIHIEIPEKFISAALYIVFLFGMISLVSHYVKRNDTVCIFSNVLNQLACQGIGVGFLSYLVARNTFPMADAILTRADALLGFNWPDYIHWVDTMPAWWLSILNMAYNSFKWQLAIVPFLLMGYLQTAHAQRFIIVLFSSVLVCIALAGMFPAVGGYNYYGMDAGMLHHLNPTFIRAEQGALIDIRAHPSDIILPLKGIICFPSFHAVVAIMLIYVSLPIYYLRWFLIPLNVVMLVSTPSDGGHYLVDVLAGIIIALLCIYAAEKALPRRTESAP